MDDKPVYRGLSNRIVSLLICAFLLIADASAQNHWKKHTSLDRSFQVEVPAPLVRVQSFEGEHGAGVEPGENIKWAKCYAVVGSVPAESKYGIIIIDGNSRKSRSIVRKSLRGGLALTLIGDDDEDHFMGPPKKVRSHGVSGDEYLYIRNESNRVFPLYTRGRVFYSARKVYVLVYIGDNELDLMSERANRFFSSFRVMKHK